MPDSIQKFEPTNLEELIKFSGWLSRSALIPRALQGKPADIAIVLMKGHDLGLSSMQALGSIDVIEGKPSVSAELVVALCLKRSDICEYFSLVESTDKKATYEAKRKGAPKPISLTYTIEQAQAAGLAGKDNWKRHPASMLRSRCSKALAKSVFPDLILNLVTEDEAEEIKEAIAREVNPPPGPPKQTERLKQLVKQNAAPNPFRVVDVKPGETEEQAVARTEGAQESPPPAEEWPPPAEVAP